MASLHSDLILLSLVGLHDMDSAVISGYLKRLEAAMSNCILYNLHLLLLQEYYGFFTPLLEIPIPTIAAINGPAIGAGFCVSMFCDLRITADDAKLG